MQSYSVPRRKGELNNNEYHHLLYQKTNKSYSIQLSYYNVHSQIKFQSSYTNLHSHYQTVSICISPYYPWHLLLSWYFCLFSKSNEEENHADIICIFFWLLVSKSSLHLYWSFTFCSIHVQVFSHFSANLFLSILTNLWSYFMLQIKLYLLGTSQVSLD